MNNLKRITRRSFFTSLGFIGAGLGLSLSRFKKSEVRCSPLLNKKFEGRLKKPSGILKTHNLG
tara:strand:+ start:299 stop:487 length:189 start_codon:yes stop_codon:yes gene_type:complete